MRRFSYRGKIQFRLLIGNDHRIREDNSEIYWGYKTLSIQIQIGLGGSYVGPMQ